MLPVAVDDKAAGIEFLEVDVAGGDAAGWQVACGEADGFRLVNVGGAGVGEPAVKLGEGRWGKLGEGKAVFSVLVCLGGGVGASRGD